MNRYRAQRLAEIARSKGIEARVYGSMPSKPGPSTPYLHSIVLRIPQQPLPAWCFNTKHFFFTLRYLLAYMKACQS